MPHVTGSSSGDDADLASSDEVKVFKDEGEENEDRRSSSAGEDDPTDMINELKQRLIDEEERPKAGTSNSARNGSPSPVASSSSASASSALRTSLSDTHLPPHNPFSGYPFPPFHHPNSTVSGGNKLSPMVPPHPASSALFMMHNMAEGFPQPPPAHTGISLDGKGIPRPTMYPQPSYPMFPDFSQWHTPSMYPMTSTAFRGPYAGPMSSPSPPNFSRYSGQSFFPPYSHLPPTSLAQHPLITGSKHHPHPDLMAAMVSLNQTHLDSRALHSYQSQLSLPHTQSSSSVIPDQKPPHMSLTRVNGTSSSSSPARSARNSSPAADDKTKVSLGISSSSSSSLVHNGRVNHHVSRHNNSDSNSSDNSSNHNTNSNSSPNGHLNNLSHVKKPLNAFMLYMKEHRNSVVQEHMLKESAAINQILGKRWHSLSREEQGKYYEKARQERQKHQQLYPGWTARDNYAINQKKKKKKRDKSVEGEPGSLKKCRARYGLEHQDRWCKPCKRKKKCIRYLDNGDQGNGVNERDNLGSVGSTEAQTPDSKSANESDGDHMMSSAELSLSSPPVPTPDAHHLLLPPSHRSIFRHHERSRSAQSHGPSSLVAALQGPPRNSPTGPNHPFSIDQLARSHHSGLV